MCVSFIIPHKGRFEMLIQTLESIAAQHYDLSKIEVLIISQTSEIQQAKLLDKPELNIKILLGSGEQTISALRNLGVTHAKGEYLAFLDADVFISPNWLEAMLLLLNEEGKNRAITSAVQICGENPPPLERIRTHLSNTEINSNVAFLPGRNLFLRRETFDKIGGFPEHLVTCEDYYFTDKAAKLGALFYSDQASYVHIGEDKVFSEMFKKEIWRGQSNLQSLSGRRIPLREVPSLIVPLWISVFLFTAGILFVGQQGQSASVALVLGLAPLMAYTSRLYSFARVDVTIWQVTSFYLIYFPARAIGTIAGLFKSIQTKSH